MRFSKAVANEIDGNYVRIVTTILLFKSAKIAIFTVIYIIWQNKLKLLAESAE